MFISVIRKVQVHMQFVYMPTDMQEERQPTDRKVCRVQQQGRPDGRTDRQKENSLIAGHTD